MLSGFGRHDCNADRLLPAESKANIQIVTAWRFEESPVITHYDFSHKVPLPFKRCFLKLCLG